MSAHTISVDITQSFYIFAAHIGCQLEVPMVEIPYAYLHSFLQSNDLSHVSDEMQQLLIIFILIERHNGHSVFQLVQVGISCVVHQDHILQTAILDDSEVFDIDALFGLPAL